MINKDHANDNFDFSNIKKFKILALEKVRCEVHENTLKNIKQQIQVIKHIATYDEMASIDKVADLFEYLYNLMESPNYREYYNLVHSELSTMTVTNPFV